MRSHAVLVNLYGEAGASAQEEQYEEQADMHWYWMSQPQNHDPRRVDHVVNMTMAPDVLEFQAALKCKILQ